MMDKQVIEAAKGIGKYYLLKNKGDHDKACDELLRLQISQIIYLGVDGIVVMTARPGLFIGKRGDNIQALEKHLGSRVRIVETTESLYDHILPRPEPEIPEYVDDPSWYEERA